MFKVNTVKKELADAEKRVNTMRLKRAKLQKQRREIIQELRDTAPAYSEALFDVQMLEVILSKMENPNGKPQKVALEPVIEGEAV